MEGDNSTVSIITKVWLIAILVLIVVGVVLNYYDGDDGVIIDAMYSLLYENLY